MDRKLNWFITAYKASSSFVGQHIASFLITVNLKLKLWSSMQAQIGGYGLHFLGFARSIIIPTQCAPQLIIWFGLKIIYPVCIFLFVMNNILYLSLILVSLSQLVEHCYIYAGDRGSSSDHPTYLLLIKNSWIKNSHPLDNILFERHSVFRYNTLSKNQCRTLSTMIINQGLYIRSYCYRTPLLF
jgi:hypothetical protein